MSSLTGATGKRTIAVRRVFLTLAVSTPIVIWMVLLFS